VWLQLIFTMAIPTSKTELATDIQRNFGILWKDLESIPENHVLNHQMEGHAKGTMMSVQNLVAYLLGWGELVLKWVRLSESGQPVVFPEEGFQWNQLGALAQKFYLDYASVGFPELCLRLKINQEKILELVESETEEKLYKQPFYRDYPLGRMIQLNSSSPYKNATGRIRRWKKEHQIVSPKP